jgi:hypothetical protein
MRMQAVNWKSQPHPDWQPGDKQPNPWGSTNFVTLDPNEMGASAYPLVGCSARCPPELHTTRPGMHVGTAHAVSLLQVK